MKDIESQEEDIVIKNEIDCPICFHFYPIEDVQNQNSTIKCSTNKHFVCNRCMMQWIHESIERRTDVKCMICNEVIYRFQVHQERIRDQEIERNRMEEENQIYEMNRNELERNIQDISQLTKKLCLGASIVFFICLGTYLFLPPDKLQNLIQFFIFYISIVLLIFILLYLNRLYLKIQLHQLNRIHPEINSS
jgi:hypothetical protein